jgi:RNA polymerase sigma-70 factor (ECF subfamily)
VTRDEFAELALSYLDEVTAFARRLTFNAADADDLVQTTFERAFRAWSTLREAGACRTWLFRIARNAYLNERRAQKARPELRLLDLDPLSDVPAIPADVVERLETRELEHALSTLSEEQREALLLSDVWGFTYSEIADITGVPVGTVRSRIARARDRVIADVGGVAGRRGYLGGRRP